MDCSVNVTGSLLLGVLTGLVLFRGGPDTIRIIIGTGFCGGYTTFSTASLETVRLVQTGRRLQAATNAVGTRRGGVPMTDDSDVERPAGQAVVVAGRSPEDDPRTTLVLGFDRDEASDAALAVAGDLAARLQAHLAVVHIVNLGDYPIDPDGPDWEDQAREALAEERSRVERALHRHRFGWSYEAYYGSPVPVLVQVAEERDAYAIVVGRHGRGVSEGLRRLIDGSVSRRLLATGGRPVLVVPATNASTPP